MKIYYTGPLFVLPTFLFLFLGCSFPEPNSQYSSTSILRSRDTLIKDIPEAFNIKKNKDFFLREQALLGMEPIENGYSGLQVRFWIGHGYVDDPKYSPQLIVIKKNADKITGELYTYQLKYNDAGDSAVAIEKRMEALNPASGWENFIDRIIKLDIFTLPDYEKIPGYYVSADSYGVVVEIAKPTKYRIYYLTDYIERKDEFKEAARMFEIMQLVEQEFKIKVIY